MVIERCGLMGTCVPHILNEMSQKLASYFGR